MEETVRSCESGRAGLWEVDGVGGGVADWPLMRVEEHSLEARVGSAVGGNGGWLGGSGVADCAFAFAFAC
jgi:hypothetical protein